MKRYRVFELYADDKEEIGSIVTDEIAAIVLGYALWQKIKAGMFRNLYEVIEVTD